MICNFKKCPSNLKQSKLLSKLHRFITKRGSILFSCGNSAEK